MEKLTGDQLYSDGVKYGNLSVLSHPASIEAFRRSLPPEEKAVIKGKRKFFKVYHAPGYWIDPKKEEARMLESYVNAFAPQPRHTFVYDSLYHWLIENIN